MYSKFLELNAEVAVKNEITIRMYFYQWVYIVLGVQDSLKFVCMRFGYLLFMENV